MESVEREREESKKREKEKEVNELFLCVERGRVCV